MKRTIVVITVFSLVVCAAYAQSERQSNMYVQVEIAGPVMEKHSLFGVLFTPQPTLKDYLDLMEKVRLDPEIGGILLEINSADLGWAKVQQLRRKLLTLRDDGKRVYAVLKSPDTMSYLLATSCDEIALDPQGMLIIPGLSAELLYLGDTLSKLGIQFEQVQMGKYKTGLEELADTKPSPETIEQIDSILDAFYGYIVRTVAESRNIDEEKVKKLIDKGMFSADDAKEAGLVDYAGYRNDLLDAMGDRIRREIEIVEDYGREEPKFDAMNVYEVFNSLFKMPVKPAVEETDKIALVYAEGMILPGSYEDYPFSEAVVPEDYMVEALRECRENARIRAVVVRINSPGGSASSSDAIWHELQLLKQRNKPVIVSLSDVAASGGYYIAMAGDTIFAEECTITGSVGVFGAKVVLSEMFDKIGAHPYILKRGENAGILSAMEPFTSSQRQTFQALMKSVYAQFTEKMRQDRGLTEEEAEAAAQGRIWTGREAVEMKLVDKIGGLEDAILRAKLDAGFGKRQEVELEIFPSQLGIMEFLQKMLSGSMPFGGMKTGIVEIDVIARHAALLSSLKNGEVMALMPFDLTIR